MTKQTEIGTQKRVASENAAGGQIQKNCVIQMHDGFRHRWSKGLIRCALAILLTKLLDLVAGLNSYFFAVAPERHVCVRARPVRPTGRAPTAELCKQMKRIGSDGWKQHSQSHFVQRVARGRVDSRSEKREVQETQKGVECGKKKGAKKVTSNA